MNTQTLMRQVLSAKGFLVTAVSGSSSGVTADELPLFFLKKAVYALLGISLIWLAGAFIYPDYSVARPLLAQATAEPAAGPHAVGLRQPAERKPIEEYLQGINNRHIFSCQPSAGELGQVSAVETSSISDIGVVGIILDGSPQAVVENKKTQQSYYVSKGQYVSQFLVADIQEGKIVLDYLGKKYELQL